MPTKIRHLIVVKNQWLLLFKTGKEPNSAHQTPKLWEQYFIWFSLVYIQHNGYSEKYHEQDCRLKLQDATGLRTKGKHEAKDDWEVKNVYLERKLECL